MGKKVNVNIVLMVYLVMKIPLKIVSLHYYLTQTTNIMSKTTLSTIKKFIRDNKNNLYLQVRSSFNLMTDCVERVEDHLEKIDPTKIDMGIKYSLGIPGLYLVGRSRDYFSDYCDETTIGYKILNSCGSCILVTKK